MAAVVNYEKDMKRLQVHKQTRLCRFFVVGACTRGEACTFAHGQDKLRQQPDFSKTRLCADFMERGSCAEGDRCSAFIMCGQVYIGNVHGCFVLGSGTSTIEVTRGRAFDSQYPESGEAPTNPRATASNLVAFFEGVHSVER